MHFLKRTTANSLAQQAEQKAREGDLAEALNLANQAVENDDKNTLVWKVMTQIQLQLGDITGAAASLEKYLELAPQDSQAWNVLAGLYDKMERPEHAAIARQKAADSAK
jgi:Tfp pilus assembly protein PilF